MTEKIIKRGERRAVYYETSKRRETSFESSQPRRGEIYRVVLDPTVGREIKKTRRCVVISNNQQNLYSPLLIIIPTTSDMDKLYSWEVVIHSEGKDRKILTDQIRSVDKKRLRDYKGQVDYETLAKIEKALGVVLALRRELQGLYDLTKIPTRVLREELMRREK